MVRKAESRVVRNVQSRVVRQKCGVVVVRRAESVSEMNRE